MLNIYMTILSENPHIRNIHCPNCGFDFKIPGWDYGLDPKVELWGKTENTKRAYLRFLIKNGLPVKCPKCEEDFVHNLKTDQDFEDTDHRNPKKQHLRNMVLKHQIPSFKDYWGATHV